MRLDKLQSPMVMGLNDGWDMKLLLAVVTVVPRAQPAGGGGRVV